MGSQFKHRKKRNSGLIYEFLVRRLSRAMVDKDKMASQKTLEILRKYFADGTVLAEEREVFEVIRKARGLTEAAARRILAEVQKAVRKMDARKIDIKKSNLIKEINYAFGQGFFNEHRVPEYRLLASIQMMVDACRTGGILTESVAEIQLEEGLVQYMTTKGEYSVRQPTQSDVDALVMRMVAKRFEEKYSKSLIPSQKVLLEKYMRSQITGDHESLYKIIDGEIKRVKESLERASIMKEVREDPAMMEKLSEVCERIDKGKSLDETVQDLMLYQKLIEEIESEDA